MVHNIGLLFTKIYFKRSTIFEIDPNNRNDYRISNQASEHFKNTYLQIKNSTLNQNNLDPKLNFLHKNVQNTEESIKRILNDSSITAEKKKEKLENLKRVLQSHLPIFLKTTYPGLLIGSGYIHDIKHENAIKLGFYFDYTTGLPVIPGSSVKGVLRSAFEKANGGYVQELLKEITEENWTNQKILALEQNIFEGKDAKNNDMSIYKRDIFFDAFPVQSNNPEKKFLANDYITPHKHPLEDPKPIQFLKVLPQVTFRFNFRLHDFKDQDGQVLLSAEQKKELFKRILLDLGIGAKTNVGYGQFIENKNITKNIREKLSEAINKVQKEIDLHIKGLSAKLNKEFNLDFGRLKEIISEYRREIQINENQLLPENDQKFLIEILNKIIKEKKRKHRENLLTKIKDWSKSHINESLIEQIRI